MEESMLYLQLFYSFLKIGLFGFGGGYAMLPLIQREVVELHSWISLSDFADMVAISQMTPGPISFNLATYVGYAATGGSIWGAAVATVAVSIPSLVIMIPICRLFSRFKDNPYVAAILKGLKVTIVGLIGAAALLLINRTTFPDTTSILLFLAAFVAALWFRVHPILLIVGAGIAGYLLY